MVQTAVEANEGRTLSVGDGAVTLHRVFHLYGFADELAIVKALGKSVSSGSGTTAIPFISQQHPVFKILYAWTYSLNKVPDAINQWRLDFEYRSVTHGAREQNPNTGGMTAGPDEVGFVEVTARLGGSFVLAYRANPAHQGPEGTEADIGGKGIDIMGNPTSLMRTQYEVVIARVSYKPDENLLSRFGAEVGTRGTGTMFGLEGGKFLYRGCNIQRIKTRVYRCQHTWIYDKWSHLIQTPLYAPDGSFEKNADGKAAHVYHEQPFPEGSSRTFLGSN